MAGHFLGAILLLAPFALVFCFKNRLRGFLYVLASVLALHLFVGLVTQAFHVFFYEVVFAVHAVFAIGTAVVLFRKRKTVSFGRKLEWSAVLAFFIIVFELWSVHFSYTGTISTIRGERFVQNTSYQYPYFSDEWVGISFIDYSIEHAALPAANPLIDGPDGEKTPNVFIPFFSMVSEMFLLLAALPLSGYVFASIAAGFIVCLLIYIFLRANRVGELPSVAATLSVPFILNGSNLPGIWYLLPFVGGLVFFLIGLISGSIREKRLTFIALFLACFLYPPIAIFAAPAVLFDFFREKRKRRAQILAYGSLLALALFAAGSLIVFLQAQDASDFLRLVRSFMLRENQDGGIPSYPLWRIVPWWVLLFIIPGAVESVKKKMYGFLASLSVGLLFWGVYNYTKYFFIIDYARTAVVTSILLTVAAGFGFQWAFEKITERYPSFAGPRAVLAAKAAVLLVFLFLSLSYTAGDSWRKLTLRAMTPSGGSVISPRAPANRYLTEDDLRLFSGISEARFISVPWKGLVVGAATKNYPLDSKASIISNNFLQYSSFMSEDCGGKRALAREHRIDYAYSEEFECEGFRSIGSSQEGLHLYKFEPGP